jgi:hypothetical protein
MSGQLELLETISLENGLILRLYNGSRLIADKLWYVALTGAVEIPVSAAAGESGDLETLDIEAMTAALGERVVFEKKMERNFIFEDKKDAELQGLRDYFMDAIATYLSHPNFSRQYILKCYREYQKKGKLEAQRLAFSKE